MEDHEAVPGASCASPRLNTVELDVRGVEGRPAAILEAGFHLDGMQRR